MAQWYGIMMPEAINCIRVVIRDTIIRKHNLYVRINVEFYRTHSLFVVHGTPVCSFVVLAMSKLVR